MQFFWFFYINKRTGGVGAKPPQIKNLNKTENCVIKYNYLSISQ